MFSPNAHSCITIGMPRCGNHAVCQILNSLGLKEQTYNPYWDQNLNKLPKRGHFVFGGHMFSVPDAVKFFLSTGHKAIYVTRDLRDWVVSWTFCMIKMACQSNPASHFFMNHNLDDCLSYAITKAPEEYYGRLGWRGVDRVYSTTYENLILRQPQEIKEIARHVGVAIPDKYLPQIMEEQKKSIYPEYFRKGVLGDWKNYFKPHHKEEFKKEAGQILIEEGYEIDIDW